MPRPRKCRKVCGMPQTKIFVPMEKAGNEPVNLTVDEYECIRLIDHQGFSQEECGEAMQVARTTVQQMYSVARAKLAAVLVEGRPLRIEGGDYRLCDGAEEHCACGGCERHRLDAQQQLFLRSDSMKIAATYENGQIFQHFGHTAQFKLYQVEDGRVVSSEVADTNGSGHGALAGFLAAHQVDALICGGIGGGAQTALKQAGIRLYAGNAGSADAAVEALLAGSLAENDRATCSHHDHGEGHTCGEHGCHH